jgi:tetratricopeptide (TPR) repeat protein
MSRHSNFGVFSCCIIILIATNSPACDYTALGPFFSDAANTVATVVNDADRTMVEAAVAPYPEGSEPPVVTHIRDEYDVALPSKAAAYYVAGVEAIFQNNKRVALWCFLEAAERNPDEPIFLNNLAFILSEYGLHDIAIYILECLKDLVPDFTAPYLNLGFAYASRGDYTEAAGNYLTAWLRNPTDEHYTKLLVDSLQKSPELSEFAYIFESLETESATGNELSKTINQRNSAPPRGAYNFLPHGTNASDAFWEVDQFVYEELVRLAQQQRDFTANTALPALDTIEYDSFYNCLTIAGNGEDACQLTFTSEECNCVWEPQKDQCDVVRQQGRLNVTLMVMASDISLVTAAHANMWNVLEENRSRLSEAEYQAFASFFDFHRQSVINPIIAEVAQDERDLAEEMTEVIETMDFYCSDLGFSKWVYTGEFSPSFEPSFCVVIICLSYDVLSGHIGVSVSLLLTGKISEFRRRG